MPTPSNNDFLEWNEKLNPAIRDIAGYTAPPQGDVRAKLNQNENPYELPDHIKQEILEDMSGKLWGRYPQYDAGSLRQKLSEKFGCNTNQILPANGSNQLLYATFTALLQPGDKVAYAPPTFSLFDLIGKIYRAEMVAIDQTTDFQIDQDQMIEKAKDAKLTLLVSPNNPTGGIINIDFLKTLLEATDGFVLWDEAYGEFWDQTAIPLINEYPNLIVSRTFSKAFSLAGLRVGYIFGHPEMMQAIQKVSVPYNLNIFSEGVACKLLDNYDWIKKTVQQICQDRDTLYQQMKEISTIDVYPSHANFILFGMKEKMKVYRSLIDRGVLIRNMGGHPLIDNTLRVTVGNLEENEIFIEELKDLLTL